MSFSSEERKAAVEGLVQGTLSFPRDKLGPRDTATAYAEIAELARTVFLYDPDAIYYAVGLAARELKRVALSELTVIDDLLDAVDDLSQPNKPIRTISPLADARVALTAIDGALSRNGSVGSREVSRYNSAMASIRAELGRTTKMTYVPRGASQAIRDVVRPSSEASAESAQQFGLLKTRHQTTMDRARQLTESLSEFLSVDLAGQVGSRQIARASDKLQRVYDTLKPLTADERTAVARQTLLDVLANQAVVKGLVDRLVPGEYKLQQSVAGSQLYRITAYGSGTAPSLEGTVSAPWPLQDTVSDELGLNLNGASQTTDLLPGGVSDVTGIARAEVVGQRQGDFSINGDLATPWPLRSAAGPFDTSVFFTFHVWVDGVHYEKQVTSGGATTASTLVSDLTLAAGWVPSKPELTFSDQGGKLQVEYAVASPPTAYADRMMEVTQGFGYIPDLWPWDGAIGATPTLIAGERSTGWDANDQLIVKANDDPDDVPVDLPTTGTWPDYLVSAADVASAITSDAVAAGESFTGDGTGGFITVRSGLYGEGSIVTILSDGRDTPSHRGMTTLGFYEGQEIRESDVTGQAVINLLNNDSWFSSRARATLVRQLYLSTGRAQRSTDTQMTMPADGDPTGDWPAAGELKMAITGGENSGVYQLSSYAWAAGTLTLNLGRRLRDFTAGLLHQIKVYREALKITSLDSSTTGRVQASGTARTILGLSTDDLRSTVSSVLVEANDSVVGWKSFDTRPRKLKATDKLFLEDGTEVTAVSSLGSQRSGLIGVSPEVSATFYTSASGFFIASTAQIDHSAFDDSLEEWIAATAFSEDLVSIDKKLSPLLLINPTKDRVDNAYNLISDLKTEIEALITLCESFVVARIKGVDRVVRSLSERGHDRARDLLLEGSISDFFATTSVDSSYGAYFIAKAADVVVEDLNQSNLAKARHDADVVRYAGSYVEDIDPQFDFSDFEDELPEMQIEDHWQGIDEDVG